MDHVNDKLMNGSSYAGSAFAIGSSLTLTEWGIVIGIVTALLTFAANIIYQIRKDRREQKLYDLKVKQMCIISPELDDDPACKP